MVRAVRVRAIRVVVRVGGRGDGRGVFHIGFEGQARYAGYVTVRDIVLEVDVLRTSALV